MEIDCGTLSPTLKKEGRWKVFESGEGRMFFLELRKRSNDRMEKIT
jgi:hypothetical protein